LQVAWLLALCLLAGLAAAQTAAPIRLNQRVQGTVSADGGSFHAFAAVHATRVRLVLELPDALGAVTLYDGKGEEIAFAEGRGEVELLHTLAADGIYLVGVTGLEPGARYRLTLAAQEPRTVYLYDDVPEPIVDAWAEPARESATAAVTPERRQEVPVARKKVLVTDDPTGADDAAGLGTGQAVADDAVDPATWGAYARLVGRRTAAPGRFRNQLAWTWARPGEVLHEDWYDSRGRHLGTVVITRGGQPGELLLRSGLFGDKEWRGRVDGDGSITFVGTRLTKLPFVVDLAPDGAYRSRTAKVDGDDRAVSIVPADDGNTWPLAPADG
jgi:hypothetical protein